MQANNNNPTAVLELIYEKHAALMYGCIYQIVQQKEIADKILSKVFIDLYKNKDLTNYNINEPVCFSKHACKASFNYLKHHSSQKEFPEKVLKQILAIRETKISI